MDHTWAICAYKDSPYLESCIKSVLGQSIKSKVEVYTSTPSDYINSLATKYDIPVYTHVSGSIGSDWNFAYDSVTTEYVTLAHQDDIYGRDYLANVMRAADRYKDMSIYTCSSLTIKEKKLEKFGLVDAIKHILRMALCINSINHIRLVKRLSLSFGNPIICPSCTYNKRLCGDHIFNEEYKFILDWDMLFNMAGKTGRFVYDSMPHMLYRVHKGAATAECIKDNTRINEELSMFHRVLPKGFADIIAKIYRSSYNAYR